MINKVYITGRLVNDTKVFDSTYDANNIWAVNTIVYNNNYKDSQWVWQSKAHFFPVESANTRVAKKMTFVWKWKMVSIEGHLVMKEKKDKQDPTKITKDISIVIDDIVLSENIKTEGEVPVAQNNYGQAPAQGVPNYQAPQQNFVNPWFQNQPTGFVTPNFGQAPAQSWAPANGFVPNQSVPGFTPNQPVATPPTPPAAPVGWLPPMNNPSFGGWASMSAAPAPVASNPVTQAPNPAVTPNNNGLSFSDPSFGWDSNFDDSDFDTGWLDISTFELED